MDVQEGRKIFYCIFFPEATLRDERFYADQTGQKANHRQTPIDVIQKGHDMLGQSLKAVIPPGVYTVEWWLGRHGNQKLAAIQLFRIRE